MIDDFIRLFGAEGSDFSLNCKRLIQEKDFSYRLVEGIEKDETVLEVLKTTDLKELSISGEHRKDDWEHGWLENLKCFENSDYDISSLVPAYVRPDRTLRFNHEYIKPKSSTFELDFYTVFRNFLFERYLKNYLAIYEFGCGTGYNLIIMAKLFPDKELHGLDWASSSKDLVNKIAKAHHYKLTGHCFDMFTPDMSLDISEQSVFITLNSMEQLGDNFELFLQYIIKVSPALCINSEPLIDLYDEGTLLDYLAAKYHRKRKYLGKYITRLKELEMEGRIEILSIQRIAFGSLFHEGYSTVIWRPKKQ